MAAKSFRIKGKEVRAVVEISPERRRLYKDFKESTEWLASGRGSDALPHLSEELRHLDNAGPLACRWLRGGGMEMEHRRP